MLKGLTASLLFCCVGLYAQSQTVSGTVTDAEKKSPLADVTIRVVGSTTVTKTDAKGAFTIKATPGQSLQISFSGYEPRKVAVTGASIKIDLLPQIAELDEVVVAMDQKRKPRELGYSNQQVTGKEIQQTQRENFINGLQGRVAGLTITPTNGVAGASSQIVLRGFNSLSLSNQPIFVVDGIILSNSTMDETSNGGSQLGLASDRPNRTNDYTNRIADINPNDIESVTVLKGPEATALYGSQASSGAIIITTRKPKLAKGGKPSITYDNSFRFQKITRFPNLNNDYASGSNGVASSSFNYFGPAYPDGTTKYDNINNFFKVGFSQTHNIGADFGGQKSTFRVSGSYFNQDGVIPRNSYKKYSLRVSNYTKINKWIDISPSINYTNATNDRPLRGAGGYYLNLFAWPIDNDVRNYLDANGHRKQIFTLGTSGEAVDNPLFNANANHSQDVTNRWVLNLGINIKPTSWLTIAGRFGYDTYKTTGYIFTHPESAVLTVSTGGQLDNWWTTYKGYNHTITATATKKVGNFSLRGMLGTMWQDYRTEMYAITGTKFTDSLWNRTDSDYTTPTTRLKLLRNQYGEPNLLISRQQAYFGEVSVGYKNAIFLTYTHRFESSSIFPKDFRNYNYPAGSLSFILTDIFPDLKRSGVLNYAKLRTSLASTARLSDPYMNQSVFVQNFASSNQQPYSYGFYNNNPYLKPERQNTYEIGAEVKLLNNRILVDAAYYNTLAYDQISQGYRASYATGFVLNTQNAATTRNQGIELSVDVVPVRKKDIDWTIRFNFNHMWSEVLKLPDAIAYEYYIADTWLYGNARGGLIRNGSTGTITGYGYARNTRGDILITPSTGLPVVDANFLVRGDRTPAFTLGTNNIIRYKNWNLSFLWDLKIGGDVYNGTEQYLTNIGKSARTNDRKTPRVIKGVLNDGLQNSANPTINTLTVTPFYQQTYYTSMPEEEFIQKNVNWFRLRDVTLNYTLSQNALRGLKGFKSLGFFITGNDLILLTNYTGADPATNGNTALSKGVGGFGFDYGNLPTPISVNFGLRANF
jgi:TonB-linked SusC/RagA family outer membrane protein